MLEAPSRVSIQNRLAAGTFPEPTIQNAHQTQPDSLCCTLIQNLTLTQAQAEIAPELALWPKNGITANLTYTKPSYADIRAAAGDLFIPPDDLWLEMLAGKSLTEAVKPTPRYDPLSPVRYRGHNYPTLFDFAAEYHLQAHRLYWIHDRRLITPERIRLMTT